MCTVGGLQLELFIVVGEGEEGRCICVRLHLWGVGSMSGGAVWFEKCGPPSLQK